LKTHTIFDTIRSVFDKSSEMLGGTQKRKNKARSLLTKIVNALTAKLEIGGPMASLYLLGYPDHYTNQNFVVFYWQSYCTILTYSLPLVTCDRHKEMSISSVLEMRCDNMDISSLAEMWSE
jgi:hypothetical protein